jgi:stringent starvation protein B
MINISQSTSTRPYLVRALHEWCTDNGFTPYVAVLVDDTVQVPREYVNNGEIVLNVSFDATSGMQLSNEFIQFKARFGGVAREIVVPMGRVIAIYAKENGQGMAFPAPAPTPAGAAVDAAVASDSPPEPPAGGPANGVRPQLKRIK